MYLYFQLNDIPFKLCYTFIYNYFKKDFMFARDSLIITKKLVLTMNILATNI